MQHQSYANSVHKRVEPGRAGTRTLSSVLAVSLTFAMLCAVLGAVLGEDGPDLRLVGLAHAARGSLAGSVAVRAQLPHPGADAAAAAAAAGPVARDTIQRALAVNIRPHRRAPGLMCRTLLLSRMLITNK